MRILIADDHEMVRDTLAAFLEREPDMRIHLAGELNEAYVIVKKGSPFDLVMLDYSMPGMNGLQGLKKMLEVNAPHPVAIISGTASKSIVEEAIEIGAIGFLPKTMGAKSWVNAVRFMASGETYLPLKFMNKIEKFDDSIFSKLSEREKQVLKYLCQGQSNKEIARALNLQEVTIKLHVKTLCRKLEAKNRTHAAMIAKEGGFL